jgi:hypothetical protein
MDEEHHPECDVYVEDERAATMVSEIVIGSDRDIRSRIRVIPYGSASVGTALGLMASQNRFPRPSVVFLDGDQAPATGCHLTPGDDAPERVVFEGLRVLNWPGMATRIGRAPAETIDALIKSMTLTNHHDWLHDAANRLIVGTEMLWQAMCASWVAQSAIATEKDQVLEPIKESLETE